MKENKDLVFIWQFLGKKGTKLLSLRLMKLDCYRKIARKFKTCHKTVAKILAEAGVQRRKRRKVPKSDEKQKIKQRIRLNKVRKTFLKPSNGLDVIMDDETYLTVDGSDYRKNDFYYTHECLPVPEEVRTHEELTQIIKIILRKLPENLA